MAQSNATLSELITGPKRKRYESGIIVEPPVYPEQEYGEAPPYPSNPNAQRTYAFDDPSTLEALRRMKGFDENNEDYQRLRKRLQNTATGAFLGGIDPEEYASQSRGLDGSMRAALQEEFGNKLADSEFFDKAGRETESRAGHGFRQGISNINSTLSDFASLDRDDDNILQKVGRGLANVPLWATRGVQAAGEGIHDMFADENISTKGVGERILDSTGVLGGGGYKQLGKQGYKGIKKAITNPGAFNPFKKDFYKAAARNKTLGGTAAASAGIGAMDADDEMVEQAAAGYPGMEMDSTPNDSAESTGAGLTEGVGSGAGSGAGSYVEAMQAHNAMPDTLDRLGGSGSKMPNLAKARMRAEAERRMDNEIKKAKGTYDPTYSEDPEGFMKNRYDSTGGRAAGAWDSMSPEDKRKEVGNYQANSSYNSASPEGRAADQRLKDSGYVAPRADGIADAARRELGMNSLQDYRAEQAPTPKMGGGNIFVDPNDPTNENKRLGQVSRDEFMEQSGMRTPGTGLTQNPDGSYNALEFGDTYEKSGGDKTAEEYLVGPQDPPPGEPDGQPTFTSGATKQQMEFNRPLPPGEPDGQPTFTSGATKQQMELNRPSLPPSDPLADQPAPTPAQPPVSMPRMEDPILNDRADGPLPELGTPGAPPALPPESQDVSGGGQEIQMPEGEIPFSPDTNFEAQSMYEKSQMPETEVMGGAVSSDPSAPEELTAPGQTGPRIEGGYAKMQNLRNQGSDRSFTTADGSSNPLDDLSQGTRRLSSNMQDYSDAAFKNKADALGYLNRQAPEPTMDEPAPALTPEAPAPEPAARRNNPFNADVYATGAGTAGLAYLLSRGKIKPGQAASLTKGQKVMTPEQFKRASTGMDPSTRAARASVIKNQPPLVSPGPRSAPSMAQPAPVPPKVTPAEFQRMASGGDDSATAAVKALNTGQKRLGNKPMSKRLDYTPSRRRLQPSQGPGGTKFTKKSAEDIFRMGKMPDGSPATKAQRIAAMQYLKANRL